MKYKITAAAVLGVLGCVTAFFWLFTPDLPETEQKKVSGARQAMDFWAAQRMYPHESFPSTGYYEAFKHSKQNVPEKMGKAKSGWQTMGPHNIGGRTLAVAFNPQNPQTIYAGSASGGLWRSYTGGVGVDAWDYVSTGFPVLGVSSIAIVPDDSNTMYIGTGEVYSYDDTQGGIAVRFTRGSYGMGILKTTDGGQNWSHVLDWTYAQGRGVWAVRLDPTDSDIVWAGTTIGTFKSLDGGQNWTQVHDVIMVMDLLINPADPDIIIVACGDLGSPGHGLYRTTNGGADWTQIVQPGVIPTTFLGKAQLAVCLGSPNVVMASIGNGDLGTEDTWLVRSEDSGQSWFLVSGQDYSMWQGWFAHDVAIDPTNANKVIAAGIDIWKSNSGGSGLVQKSEWWAWFFGQVPPGGPEGPPYYSHADHHDIVYHPTDPNIIYFGNDGGVFRSLDGGESFEGCNGGYQTQQFYAGFSSSQSDSFHAMGGMQDNATAIYDGTLAWIRVIGGDGGWTAIDPDDDDVIYGSYQFLNILKSTDRGENWNTISPPNIGNTSFIAPFRLGNGGGALSKVYAGRSYIFRSINGGANWSTLINMGANPALAMAVSALNDNVVYVTTAPVYGPPEVFRTVDGGQNWANVSGGLPDRYPVGLGVDPNADGTVYVTFSGYGTGHVFRSNDAGGQWFDMTNNLPDAPTSSVVVDPLNSNHVYVGNDIGVYVSTNGGLSWEEYSLGMPDAVIAMDLTISPTNRKLRVSTYGNGVFERDLLYTVTDVPDGEPLLTRFVLEPNHPNPFNPSTTIRYKLIASGDVELVVYNAAGERVRSLVRESQEAGDHAAHWDGRDAAGREVPSGVYLYELKTAGQSETRKMMLLK